MTTARYPVFLSTDDAGRVTATLICNGFQFSAVGANEGEAIAQVDEFIVWSFDVNNAGPVEDFFEPELTLFTIPVRPEYQVVVSPIERHIYPCMESIPLRVACVHGRQSDGLRIAALPALNFYFLFPEKSQLRDLVHYYVQDILKARTPQQISRFLPPARMELSETVVRLPKDPKWERDEPSLVTLTRIAEPLGERSLRRQLSRAYEREKEVADLVERLEKEKACVLLVGESGAGKTAVLVDAVRKLELAAPSEDDERPVAGGRRLFWSTSAARVIAGMKYLGQWQERVQQIISEISDIGGVLCIENLLDLIRSAGRDPAAGIAAFLQPYVQRGDIRIVGEATPAELDACRRLLPGFVDLFQILRVPPFGAAAAIRVLARVALVEKQNRSLEVERGVPEIVYRLFTRFAPYQAFPGKAIGFLRELFEKDLQRGDELTIARAIAGFSRKSGLPEFLLRDEIPLDMDAVHEAFAREVMGQEAACHAMAGVVAAFKAGLNDPHRPIGVLLFCGPTGVGKTELAKAVARFFFGHGEAADRRLIRLDMSEYASYDAAERLLGDPAGEPGELVRRVRQQPLSVILFDEIEKAAPQVFDVLMGVFDEGRLTDPFGRVTLFRSAIIIMTSNLGSDQMESVGLQRERTPSYDAAAMSFFRPEFYNRIDAVVTFQPLSAAMIRSITEKELREVGAREGLVKANLSLRWTDALLEHLAREGFDRRYGARPLQRTLERLVVGPLARFLVDLPGLRDTAIIVDVVDGKVSFDVA